MNQTHFAFLFNYFKGDKIMSESILTQQLDALLQGENNIIANLANASALLNEHLSNINWVGFYLYDQETKTLNLGPFQGKVACMHIPLGQGVCGSAIAEQKILRVANVHEFAGHIACDAASNSEIVLPLIKNGEILGVLDIDSPELNRFSAHDEQELAAFVTTLLKHI